MEHTVQRRTVGVGTAVVCVWLLLPVLSSAQGIRGRVTDATPAVLPGVAVEARSPALIEQVRTVTTDGAGRYHFVSLRPGTYHVTFTLPGFNSVVREGIELTTGFTAPVDAELPVGDLEETITVSGNAPVVDITNTGTQVVRDREVIDTIPTGRSFQNLTVLIPGIVLQNLGVGTNITQDVGGQSGQRHRALSIHGGDWRDQELLVDGMSVSGWIGGTAASSPFWFMDANFEEYAIDLAAHSAESEAGGVRINMIPREGGNTFTSRTFFDFATEGFLQADNVDDELRQLGLRAPNRVKRLWHFNTAVGGPIVRNTLRFYASLTRRRTDSFVANVFENQDPAAWVYVPDLSRQGVDDQDATDASIRLTWQATPRNRITAHYNNNFNCLCHANISSSIMPEASADSTFDNNLYQVNLDLSGHEPAPARGRCVERPAAGSL